MMMMRCWMRLRRAALPSHHHHHHSRTGTRKRSISSLSSSSPPVVSTSTPTPSPSSSKTTTTTTTTVVVALSGGVDSAVAGALLRQQCGNDNNSNDSNDSNSVRLQAVHLSNWDARDDDTVPDCAAERDWEMARQVAQHLQFGAGAAVERVTALAPAYWLTTFEPFVEQLQRHGVMGNPDVDCNARVKFGALLDYVRERYGGGGNDNDNNPVWLATGHYARLWYRDDSSSCCAATRFLRNPTGTATRKIPECVEEAVEAPGDYPILDGLRHWGNDEIGSNSNNSSNSNPLLLAAADRSKDQSYFLSGCRGASLRHVLFPLGDHYKNESSSGSNNSKPTVRRIAADLELPNARRRDSTGLCFVGARPAGFRHFVRHYLAAPARRLQFVDIDTHRIVHQTATREHHVLYTTGQGAKLPGLAQKYFCVDHNHRWFPYNIGSSSSDDSDEFHTVTVCAGTHHPALYSDSFTVQSLHWIAGGDNTTVPPQLLLPLSTTTRTRTKRWMRAQCRTRHLQPLVGCTLEWDSAARPLGVVTVHLDRPLRGVTVGQQAVFYTWQCRGVVCLGGGPIHERGPSYWHQGRALPPRLHPAGHNDASVVVAAAQQPQQPSAATSSESRERLDHLQ